MLPVALLGHLSVKAPNDTGCDLKSGTLQVGLIQIIIGGTEHPLSGGPAAV